MWSAVESNIKKIKTECPHIHIGIASVISIFNVYTIPEFISYLIKNNLIDNKTSASFYCLVNPNFYSFNILNQDFKKIIIDKLSKTQYNSNNINTQIQNVINHLQSSTYDYNLQRQFKRHTEYYDSIRNKKFTETFTELKEFYENIF